MGLTLDRRKNQLRRALALDRTLTTVQIERRGLLGAAEALDLPSVPLTCRTRVTQPHSNVNLTFVALDPAILKRTERELMHYAGIAEARERSDLTGGVWRHVSIKGKTRLHLPDAEYIVHDGRTSSDWAIEFDAGYGFEKVRDKLRAAEQSGYRQFLWSTTVRARPGKFGDFLQELESKEPFETLRRVDVTFVDFWTNTDRTYTQSRRNHKVLSQTYPVGVDAVR